VHYLGIRKHTNHFIAGMTTIIVSRMLRGPVLLKIRFIIRATRPPLHLMMQLFRLATSIYLPRLVIANQHLSRRG
jgi:hypothetical protein